MNPRDTGSNRPFTRPAVADDLLRQRLNRPQAGPTPSQNSALRPGVPLQPVSQRSFQVTPAASTTPVAHALQPAQIPVETSSAPTVSSAPQTSVANPWTRPTRTPVMRQTTLSVTSRGSRRVRRLPPLRTAVLSLVAIVLMTGVAAAGVHIKNGQNTLNSDLRSQIGFGVFYPISNGVLKADKTTASYEPGEGIFRYTAYLKDGSKVLINEQATPDTVAKGNSFNQLLTTLHPFGSVESQQGTLALTHPELFNGDAAGVINAQGSLVFIRPSRELSKTEWQQLANALAFLPAKTVN